MTVQQSANLVDLISTFYKVGIVGLAKRNAHNQNTQHTKHTNQPNWSIAVLPPSGFALYRHGNSHHDPNSRHSIFQWVHARLALAFLAVPRSVPLRGVPTHTPSKNRAMGLALALSGQNLKGKHINQPSVGVSGGMDSEEVAHRGWIPWGNTVPSSGTSNGATQK